jgi:hypothetical protein
MQINQMCTHSTLQELKVYLVTGAKDSFGAEYTADLPFFSGSNLGMWNSTSSNFDGVACNEGNQIAITIS